MLPVIEKFVPELITLPPYFVPERNEFVTENFGRNLGDLWMWIAVRGDIKDQTGAPLPHGWAGAQASHAATMASMGMAMKLCSKLTDQPEKMLRVMETFNRVPFTKIKLRARDEFELNHLIAIAEQRQINYAKMMDNNPIWFGTYRDVFTAVAFGPYPKGTDIGLTDYLPKWSNELGTAK